MSGRRPAIPKAPRPQGGGEMSLINDMLRNLEAKRPDDLARQNLQREIRSLPPESRGSGAAIKLGLLTVLLLAVGAAAWYGKGIWSRPPAESMPLPVAAAPSVAPNAPTTEGRATPARTLPGEPSVGQLRLASRLEFVPLPVAPVLSAMHTAISSSLVLSVISVHRLDECTT